MSPRLRPTWLEIDTEQIARNVRLLRTRARPQARLMAVVKADAYGHGAVPVARAALEHGATALGVAIPEEGAQLREAGIGAPILVLGGVTEAGARAAVEYGLTQTVFDAQTADWLAKAAREASRPARVHIKLDTGMGRVGVREEARLLALAETILSEPSLVLEGVFTHFATADGADLDYTRMQSARFEELVAPLRERVPGLLVHAANSAAILRCPWAHYDMVRAGIALYVRPGLPGDAWEGLGQAMRWVTHAVHVKEIAPGQSVGYGCAFTAERPTRVMTLPVGYADGYHRAIGGRGRVLVRGRSAPVIGRVCMDQAMVDVTRVPGADLGDEVVLLGAQGDGFISAREMGGWCDMIDYEILLSPTGRVPKVYV